MEKQPGTNPMEKQPPTKNKIIFIGPQGSGKGTQAKITSKKLKIPHISTGDLVRGASGELKKEIDNYINKGNLVPDELIIKILKERISQPDCEKGFILDGFPRNIAQAHALDKITPIDKVIEIHISDEESIRRLSSRLTCKNCGHVFNKITNPPKEENICDNCHSQLIQRNDDLPETIKKRLKIYHDETEPILNHYSSIKINGEQPIENVQKDIVSALH